MLTITHAILPGADVTVVVVGPVVLVTVVTVVTVRVVILIVVVDVDGIVDIVVVTGALVDVCAIKIQIFDRRCIAIAIAKFLFTCR